MDMFEDPTPQSNAPELSVSELSGAIKRVIEGEFGFVRVRGEVGRVSRPRSGHIYLDLKDDRSVISGVIWKGVAARLQTPPEEGLEVIATGRLTTFGGQSKYQIVIEDIRPAGVGALMAMLEKRKAALAAEGLFDQGRKRPLPYLPQVIGVVTSPSGAVIRDILHRLRDRFPRKVLVWPVAVQGERCAPQVAAAIEGFNRLTPGGALPRPDLLIVARGGGSLEDLWGFNEEIVARAAAGSAIPLISAVGHETDTTLIDFVSDKRAPTPTAAAELAVPVRLDLLATVETLGARMAGSVTRQLTMRKTRLADLSRALPRPATLLQQAVQRLDILSERLPRALISATQRQRLRLTDISGVVRPALLERQVAGHRRTLARIVERLPAGLDRTVRLSRRDLDRLAGRLRADTVQRQVQENRKRLTELTRRFQTTAGTQLGDWSNRLDTLERLRRTLGYEATLQRGYAVVRAENRVITQKSEAEAAAALEIQFADGRLRLGNDASAPSTAKPKRKPAAPPPSDPEQGSLF